MKRLAITVLAFATMGTALAANAPSFKERLSRAERAQNEAVPNHYLQTQFAPALNSNPPRKMIAACLKAPGADKVNLTMVATVSQGGRIIDVDYRPRPNKTGRCLAKAIRSARRLPTPPAKYRHGLPVFIDWPLADKHK